MYFSFILFLSLSLGFSSTLSVRIKNSECFGIRGPLWRSRCTGEFYVCVYRESVGFCFVFKSWSCVFRSLPSGRKRPRNRRRRVRKLLLQPAKPRQNHSRKPFDQEWANTSTWLPSEWTHTFMMKHFFEMKSWGSFDERILRDVWNALQKDHNLTTYIYYDDIYYI